MKKLVTIIMSVYNSEKHLKNAIDSILNQSYQNFEFIIIDDNSTDDTWDILINYNKKDPRVKIYKNTVNKGLPENLNNAIKISEGDYIARMDGDDISDRKRIERQVEYLEHNPDISMVGSFSWLINEEGENIGQKRVHLTTNFKKLLRRIDVIHASVMFRGDFFKKYGFYDPYFKKAQDMDLWLRATEKGATIATIPEYLYYIRSDRKLISRRKLGQKFRIEIKKKYLSGLKYYKSIIPNVVVIYTPCFILNAIWLLKNRAR
ncbi:MAG: glycosyltransferase family 2 protein [bacterium]